MGLVLLILGLLNVILDFHYFVRSVFLFAFCAVKVKLGYGTRDAFRPVIQQGICLTTDLDVMMHMNNSRYLREADFGRFHLWLLNGIGAKARQLKCRITLGGVTIRYRKSLQLFERYRLHTSIVYWDEKAFYLEQKFQRCRDDFVVAIMYAKQNFVDVTPAEILRQLSGKEKISPDPTVDLKKWIEYNELSSESLKKSS